MADRVTRKTAEPLHLYTAQFHECMRRGAQAYVQAGTILLDVKAHVPHGAWERWVREDLGISTSLAGKLTQVARRFKSVNFTDLPIDPSALYLLAAPSTPDVVVQEALEVASQGEVVSHMRAKRLIHQHRGVLTLADHRVHQAQASAASDAVALPIVPESPADQNGHTPRFNHTNASVDWAWWTWNPVTGCLHDCEYCYARDIANRYYPEKFEPTFHRDRLHAPHATKVPPEAATDMRAKSVFVCSMADLFGKWVPQAWIDAVLAEVRAAPQWNFLFLTKFPQRLASLEWPPNAWVGTTVDRQYRVAIAEKAFRKVNASVKWLSCEPLLEDLHFTSVAMFDWVVLGGASASTQTPAFQPSWSWVEHLLGQARLAKCLVYMKPNLTVRSQEYPGAQP